MKKEHAGGSAVYGIGFLGALVYFVQQAHDIGSFVMGFIQAIFWPGILVYKAFELLKF